LSKTNGKVIGDVMTSAPLVVRETTNLEDAARYVWNTASTSPLFSPGHLQYYPLKVVVLYSSGYSL
jgi:hypothetical protein